MTQAIESHGTLVKLGDGETPENFTTIAELGDIDLPEWGNEKEEVTVQTTAGRRRAYRATLATKVPELSLPKLGNKTLTGLQEAVQSGLWTGGGLFLTAFFVAP